MRNKVRNNNLSNTISKGGVLYRPGEIPKLTKEQIAQANLVSKLPRDFPIANWESMSTRQQLQQMKNSGLNEKDQWSLLNSNIPLAVLNEHNQAQDEIARATLVNNVTVALAKQVVASSAPRTQTNIAKATISTPLQMNGLRQKLNVLKDEYKEKPLGKASGGIGAAVAPKAIGNVTANVGVGFIGHEEQKSDSKSSSTPQLITIETEPPIKTPRMTPTPSPELTPPPTPKPTANLDMIRQLVIDQRNQKNQFYMKYSQTSGDRSDCSTQVYDFYKIKADKNPFLGAEHKTCESYYMWFIKHPDSIIDNGGIILSSVPSDNRNGISPIPDKWQDKTEVGDIVIWKDKAEIASNGYLVKANGDDWHIGLCTGDQQMVDRGIWEENNPNGKEYGIFVRGLDTVKSSYDVILIIKPGDDVKLTRDDIYDYLIGH